MSEEPVLEPVRLLYVQIDEEGRPARWSSSPLTDDDLTMEPVDDPRGFYRAGDAWLPVPAGERPGMRLDPVAGAWVLDANSPEFRALVNTERQRRILAGGTFTLPEYPGTVTIIGDEATRKNLDTLAFKADLLTRRGLSTTVTQYRDFLNVTHPLTQPQVLSLWEQGGARYEAIMAASWAIKAAPPADGDVSTDPRWPA